jgi:hypothetical protein
MLLASSGLLVQTFLHLSKQSWGFEPSNVPIIQNSLRGESYGTALPSTTTLRRRLANCVRCRAPKP